MRFRPATWATPSVVLICALACFLPSPAKAVSGSSAHREDHGDLIVLHLYGSYYEMGRQQAALLGPVAHRMISYHLAEYRKNIARGGTRLRLIDLGNDVLPFLGPLYEDSGFFDEMNGAADNLGVSRGDLLRAVTATTFGSTVFAATRTATADGGAIIGRNVDWADGDGTMRPVVMHFHPDNGDLAYIMGGWPLIGAPAIGINEAGLALSFNFFVTDETLGLPPEMRDRRALQTARTVDEAIRVFTEVRKRAVPTFMVMADATGDIAMLECTPSDCAVFRPEGDWFAQANHARTEKMTPLDRYRSPDSFARRAAMEEAVRPHLGAITPEVASRIIRDRSNSLYVNDPTVANLYVLNAAVIQPRRKVLWHSTSMQPAAPFGEMLPFSVGADISKVPALPADPRLGTTAMQREIDVIEQTRRAVRLFATGQFGKAGAIWDELANTDALALNPDRLAFGRAVARWRSNDLVEADVLFTLAARDEAPFSVRATSLVLRGVLADESGRRDDAVALYERAGQLLGRYPQFTDTYTQRLRSFVQAGRQSAQSRQAFGSIPDLQYVPK